MRYFCVILFLFLTITFCNGQGVNCNKGGHHHHNDLYLHHLHFLTYAALKFKVILVIGSIWTFFIIIGKIFAAFKLIEYMKAKEHPHVVYSSPPHDYHHHLDKSFDYPIFSSSGFDAVIEQPSNSLYNSYPSKTYVPQNKYIGFNKNPGKYSTIPPTTGRSYLISNNSTPLENLNVFFKTINRMNVTEIVFKEMKLDTTACKKRFVCEADFNIRQSAIVRTIFELFIDNCYKKYRTKEKIVNLEECSKLNPECSDQHTFGNA